MSEQQQPKEDPQTVMRQARIADGLSSGRLSPSDAAAVVLAQQQQMEDQQQRIEELETRLGELESTVMSRADEAGP